MSDKHPQSAQAEPRGDLSQHREKEPPEGRWAHAHGDAWVVAEYRDGGYRCSECRIVLVAPR
jgi:hypothetical protein